MVDTLGLILGLIVATFFMLWFFQKTIKSFYLVGSITFFLLAIFVAYSTLGDSMHLLIGTPIVLAAMIIGVVYSHKYREYS